MHKIGIYNTADLLDRCRVDDITGCWLWAGHMDRGSLPKMWCPHRRTAVTAGHFLYALMNDGQAHAKDMTFAPMKCMNRQCVNPAHRRLVTIQKCRKAFAKPLDPVWRMKVTRAVRQQLGASPEELHLIRTSDTPASELAKHLGRSAAWIRMVRNGTRQRDQLAPNASVFSMAI